MQDLNSPTSDGIHVPQSGRVLTTGLPGNSLELDDLLWEIHCHRENFSPRVTSISLHSSSNGELITAKGSSVTLAQFCSLESYFEQMNTCFTIACIYQPFSYPLGYYTRNHSWLLCTRFCFFMCLCVPQCVCRSPDGSVGKESTYNAGDSGLVPGWEDPLEKG